MTFDLIGLPPTPEEINDFLADRSPGAFVRLIDRLLASPHYGERWGRHWMDVVRYADTAGDNADYPIPEAVRLSRLHHRFVQRRQALRPDDSRASCRRHSGAKRSAGTLCRVSDRHRVSGAFARYATAPFELWHLTLEDTIDTTGRAFLGLTLRCARCHDHKFDPVSQRDYYSLYGIFASTTFPYAGSEELQSKSFPRMNFVPISAPKDVAAQARSIREAAGRARSRGERPWKRRAIPARSRRQRSCVRNGRSCAGRRCRRMFRAVTPSARESRSTCRCNGGANRKAQVRWCHAACRASRFWPHEPPRGVATEASGRLELADWLTQPAHPLTARVMANRVWQYHFGRGIVATPSNFGVRGEPPSHPELLDWLAAKFVADGWSIKRLHREILRSETYKLSSEADSSSAARDPEDWWLWRFPAQRMDAETIRDAMLFASGLLAGQRPGPHPFPPMEAWHWTQHDPFKAVYPTRARSVYLMTQRLVKHPFMAIFDGADTNASTDLRPRSTVPLQALYLRNNPFVQEQANALADRLLARPGDRAKKIGDAYELTWGRPPEPAEVERWLNYLAECRSALARAQTPQPAIERQAWSSLAKVMLTSNEFLYID